MFEQTENLDTRPGAPAYNGYNNSRVRDTIYIYIRWPPLSRQKKRTIHVSKNRTHSYKCTYIWTRAHSFPLSLRACRFYSSTRAQRDAATDRGEKSTEHYISLALNVSLHYNIYVWMNLCIVVTRGELYRPCTRCAGSRPRRKLCVNTRVAAIGFRRVVVYCPPLGKTTASDITYIHTRQ